MNRGSDAPVPKPPRRAVCGNDPTGAPGGVPPDPIDGLRASAPTIGNAEGTAIVAHRRGGGADRASRRGVGFLPRGGRVGVGIRQSIMRRPGRTPGPRARPGRARPSAPPRRTRRRSARSQRGAPSPRRRPARLPPPVARPPNPVRTPESKNPPRRAPPRRPRDSLSARNRPRGRTCTARAPHPSTSRPDEARARRPIAPPARRTPVRIPPRTTRRRPRRARATPTSAEVPTCGRGGGGVHRRHRRRHHREGRRRESREGGGRGRVGVGIVESSGTSTTERPPWTGAPTRSPSVGGGTLRRPPRGAGIAVAPRSSTPLDLGVVGDARPRSRGR